MSPSSPHYYHLAPDSLLFTTPIAPSPLVPHSVFLTTGTVVTLVGPGAVNLTSGSSALTSTAGGGGGQQPGVLVLESAASWKLLGPSGLALMDDASGVFISETDGAR